MAARRELGRGEEVNSAGVMPWRGSCLWEGDSDGSQNVHPEEAGKLQVNLEFYK